MYGCNHDNTEWKFTVVSTRINIYIVTDSEKASNSSSTEKLPDSGLFCGSLYTFSL